MADTISRLVIPALWIAWLAYWIVAAVGSKPVERRESVSSRWTYLIPLMIGGVLLGSPHLGAVLGYDFVAHSPATFWIAVALIAIGLGFASLARAWLGSNWSATVTLKQNHELVRSGPYGIVRHPIYTGLMLAILGTALSVGQVRAMVAVVLIGFSFVLKLKTEEKFMSEQFGEEYRRYQAEVPALVPFWPQT